ncbi:unnamed protein product [Linum trigynum]|uniref:Uncharacterized protein n=1 Tax=Linum trigynum TaxID=586398 RepID=A0AAV2FPC7_9ROSI
MRRPNHSRLTRTVQPRISRHARSSPLTLIPHWPAHILNSRPTTLAARLAGAPTRGPRSASAASTLAARILYEIRPSRPVKPKLRLLQKRKIVIAASLRTRAIPPPGGHVNQQTKANYYY